MESIPKGLQLERKYNPIIVDGANAAISSQIEDILSNGKRKIHKLTLDHHRKLSGVIGKKLEAVEAKIGGIIEHPNATAAIRTTLQKELDAMEREEDGLRLAL